LWETSGQPFLGRGPEPPQEIGFSVARSARDKPVVDHRKAPDSGQQTGERERGASTPSMALLQRLAKALRVPVTALLE
jgi:transcriptional regulator with XRE-family HTH domain